MYLIAIAWMYVALMMALAEATASTGSILGACITFLLYGVLPCALLLYMLGTPERKRRLHAQRQQAQHDWDAAQQAAAAAASALGTVPNDGGHAPSAGAGAGAGTATATDRDITPVREKL